MLNLRGLYGHRYRIALDESARYEPGGNRDPWYLQIPCRHGHIYPYSAKRLAFYCTSAKTRARLHRAHSDIKVAQWSDDGEVVFLFAPERFDVVAEYAQPRRKRRLSTEHREKLTKAGLRALEKHREANSNRHFQHPESTIS